MDQIKMNEYYKELIVKLTQISNKIVELNDLYDPFINFMNDSLIIDGKIIGKEEIDLIKKHCHNIKEELMSSIIPDIKYRIK